MSQIVGNDDLPWECPDWYYHIQAAKYLGVRPDELSNMPIWWKQKALTAITAENEAREILQNRK